MNRYFLGIDVGTSSTKALVVGEDGATVSTASASYPLLTPREGWVEQRPSDWWRAVVAAVREATARVEKGRIAALGLSTQGNTVLLADGAGQPLGSAITWLDQRAQQERAELLGLQGEEYWYERTGLALSPVVTLAKLRWLSKHEPGLLQRAHRVLLVGDFILHQLTGRYCTDVANAASTMLVDASRGVWDPELLAVAGVDREQMPPIMESGRELGPLTAEAADALGLRPGIPVAVGGFDQCCAAIGAGVVQSGQALLSCGSAWVITYNADAPFLDRERRVWVQRHSIPGKWAILAVMSNGGVVVDWVLQHLAGGREASAEAVRAAREILFARLSDLPPGSSGKLFLPYFTGAPSPHWQPDARGALLGLKLSDGPAELFKAALEGIGLEVAWNLETVESLGFPVESIRMAGGAANSPAWAQLLADVTNRSVTVPANREAAALGAATLAAWALGVWPGGPPARDEMEAVHRPDPARAAVYRQLSEIYREAFSMLLGLSRRLNAVEMAAHEAPHPLDQFV